MAVRSRINGCAHSGERIDGGVGTTSRSDEHDPPNKHSRADERTVLRQTSASAEERALRLPILRPFVATQSYTMPSPVDLAQDGISA